MKSFEKALSPTSPAVVCELMVILQEPPPWQWTVVLMSCRATMDRISSCDGTFSLARVFFRESRAKAAYRSISEPGKSSRVLWQGQIGLVNARDSTILLHQKHFGNLNYLHSSLKKYLFRWNFRYLRMLLVGMKVQDTQARIFQLQRFPGLPGCGGRVVCLISWQ